jgi:hypothetical protein
LFVGEHHTNNYFVNRQADLLLERLLVRLAAAETTMQRQNLSFCISELTVTEKGLKKLLEMIK